MTKEEFLKQIVDVIKAGHPDPCNRAFVIYTLPREENRHFRFGISVGAIEGYTEKDFGELSDEEVKQAMLDIVDEFGVDDWYQDYQHSLETED